MDDKYVIYNYFTENGVRKHTRMTLSLSEWEQQQENHPLWSLFGGNMGIGGGDRWYYELEDGQDPKEESNKINEFVNKYLSKYAKLNNSNREDISYQFINYGKTQLVYVMTDSKSNKLTLLVKQPAVKYGAVKQEHDILCELNKFDNHVIAPIDYFSDNGQELYVTPYLEQARCVASDENWGVYVPEPIYRFEEFNDGEADIINACMIAKLISYYNHEKQEGLASCKLGGGDFMLAKGYEKQHPTIEWIMNNLYLIAGREKIKCSFEEYIDLIRKEFSRRTIDDKIAPKINVRGRVKMTTEQIENGIILGRQLLEYSKEKL